MKNLLVLFLFFSFSTLSLLNAQDENMGMDPEMMKAWQEYMTPGAMHDLLAKSVGEWKTEISSWMDPNMPPTVTEGKSVCEAMLGGRFFHSKETANFMGMPFEGSSITGYDNATKKFFSYWVDNMSTGGMILEGSYDEATKTLTFTGKMTEPMGTEMSVREVVKSTDNDHSTFEMYMDMGGKEIKNMEIQYTRVK
jgi:hypothetical protein